MWTVGQTGKKISVNSNKTEISVDRALVVPYCIHWIAQLVSLTIILWIMIYPMDNVDAPFEQLLLRSLWTFIRSSKDACTDLQRRLKILKSLSPGCAIQRLSNWGQKYMLIPRFWRETNFFGFVLLVYLSFSLDLPQTTTTKVTPASKYLMKIKV